MHEEACEDLGEDYASLRLVVWDVAGVLEELREVDFVEVELADFGFELWGVRLARGDMRYDPSGYLHIQRFDG